MDDRPNRFAGEPGQTDELAPENENSEQVEADQAQDVADEARDLPTSAFGLGDTEKVGDGIDDINAQDLVDHMNQMVSSGRVDMSAFRGEPEHDDEADNIRKQVNGGPGGDPDDADNPVDRLH